MRQVCFPISNTHSSTRSHTKWLTGAFYKSGGARSMLESSKRLNGSILDRLSEHVELLAPPRLTGRAVGKGRGISASGRQKSRRRSATQEAIAYFEQALEALKHLPESQPDD